jgi:hypothetical protein
VERRRRGTEACWHRQIQPLFLHFIYRETLIKNYKETSQLLP